MKICINIGKESDVCTCEKENSNTLTDHSTDGIDHDDENQGDESSQNDYSDQEKDK